MTRHVLIVTHGGRPRAVAALTEAVAQARADKDAAEERWLALAELVEG